MLKNRNLLLLPVILIVIASLINSRLFVSWSLAAYILFTIAASGFVFGVGLYIVFQKKQIRFTISLPTIFFITWGLFIFLDMQFLHTPNSRHWYLLISILFYLALLILFKNTAFPFEKLPLIIIIPALFEALFCIGQYFSLLPSYNLYFKVTGTWSNPNVTAMFLAMSLAPVIGLTIKRHKELRKRTSNYHLSFHIISLILIIIALIMLRCRTALIGAGIAAFIVLNYRFGLLTKLFGLKNWLIGIGLLIFILGLGIPFATKMYKVKQDSADGRTFVWKTSLKMITDKPFLGFGYGRFEREYNLYQAKYFESEKATNHEIENSSHVKMAYNELIDKAVEGGIIGLILFIGAITSLFVNGLKSLKKDNSNHKNNDSSNNFRSFETCPINIIAFAGISAFFLMSLVNFTMQAPPVMCMFIIYAAVLAHNDGNISTPAKLNKKLQFSLSNKKKYIVTGIVCTVTMICIVHQYQYGLAHLHLKQATEKYSKGDKSAIINLQNIGKYLKKSEYYHIKYADILTKENKIKDALDSYEKALLLTSDPKIYIQLAYCYMRLNNIHNAETNFQTAMCIQPSLFEPRFALMQLHKKNGNINDARIMAEGIVTLKPKVPSKQVVIYKREAQKLLIPKFDSEKKDTKFPKIKF